MGSEAKAAKRYNGASSEQMRNSAKALVEQALVTGILTPERIRDGMVDTRLYEFHTRRLLPVRFQKLLQLPSAGVYNNKKSKY